MGRQNLMPGEPEDIMQDVTVQRLRGHWLDAEHAYLGGRKPRDLIGTDDEPRLRWLLHVMRRSRMPGI